MVCIDNRLKIVSNIRNNIPIKIRNQVPLAMKLGSVWIDDRLRNCMIWKEAGCGGVQRWSYWRWRWRGEESYFGFGGEGWLVLVCCFTWPSYPDIITCDARDIFSYIFHVFIIDLECLKWSQCRSFFKNNTSFKTNISIGFKVYVEVNRIKLTKLIV